MSVNPKFRLPMLAFTSVNSIDSFRPCQALNDWCILGDGACCPGLKCCEFRPAGKGICFPNEQPCLRPCQALNDWCILGDGACCPGLKCCEFRSAGKGISFPNEQPCIP